MAKMNSKEENITLQQQAINWLILMRSDDVNDQELYDFAEWLAEDHAHSEAFSAAEELFDAMALGLTTEHAEYEKKTHNEIKSSFADELKNSGTLTRFKNWMILPTAFAAIWAFAVFLFLPQKLSLLETISSDFHTQTGEIREINLSDGSQLLLDTNSAVSLSFNQTTRKVILHHGQARFKVAKDLDRPFFVNTENLDIQALGTIFQVSKQKDDKVKITVQEHKVLVSRAFANLQQQKQVMLEEGEQLKVSSEDDFSKPVRVAIKDQIAWQENRLIINDRPLSELISEIERYRYGRIFLSDPELRQLRVTGVFSLSNPDEILSAVCQALGLKETRLANWWSVVHY